LQLSNKQRCFAQGTVRGNALKPNTDTAVYNTFSIQRHLISRKALRQFRSEAVIKLNMAIAAA
jgi:hypothetical protein